MRATRRELAWSLLLFLLLSGGISFAEQNGDSASEALKQTLGHCEDSASKSIACLRALRIILDNAKSAQQIRFRSGEFGLAEGIQLDREEEKLEHAVASLSPEERHSSHFHQLAENISATTALDNLTTQEALDAALSATDPHAHIAQESKQDLWGVGAFLRRHEDQLHVLEVLPNSSAARAGLKEGDTLLEINGIPAQQISNQQRHELFREATLHSGNLQLLVLSGNQRKWLSVPAEHLRFSTIEERRVNNVALIQVRNFFREDTCQAIARSLRKLEKQEVKGIVLDLRNNPGGLVREAICVGGLFMGPNIVMAKFEALKNSQEAFQVSTMSEQVSHLPMLVLVNENTASAAEIVAASLQDQNRAKVIGIRTFGKGTMQSLIRGNLPIYKSTHRIFRASGDPLQKLGVEPNYALKEKGSELREEDLFGNVLAKYGALTPKRGQHEARINTPCTKAALQQSPQEASAALLQCTL